MKPIVFKPEERARLMRMIDYQLSALSPNRQYRLEIKEHRNKRSLDANAYFWVLAHKLAEASGIPISEVYQRAIKEIGGVSEHYCGKPEAIDRLCATWSKNGMGWVTETFESKLPGMLNATLYYGSSTYDTAQMSRLIDNVVQDCKDFGIETETPERLNQMMEMWDAQINKSNGNPQESKGSSLGA